MKIGVISDTHDQVDNLKKAIKVFKKEKVSLIYHLGDVCSPYFLMLFKEFHCEVKLVFGNNDADIYSHMKACPENVRLLGRFYIDHVDGKIIALIHGDIEGSAEALFKS
ncbi:MAG: YfcE family phosphodiesterase, partial [Nanoarchaeota archaeon]|nr:YfcE family phosphodiesterase [Nanoarchaeota archaeon]